MTPNFNFVCIYTCQTFERFTLLWDRLWILLAGHVQRDVETKSVWNNIHVYVHIYICFFQSYQIFTIYFLGVPRLLQCYCNWLLLCNFMGQCERFSEPAVSVNSILPERKNSDPLNGRWLANSDGDFFSLWKSDQVVLTILQKLKQCCTPHLLIILFSNVLLLMLNFVLTFGFT